MAPLLRASVHGLRRSRLVPSPFPSSQRELCKPPESSNILRRWFGESAALEETCSSAQTVNDTAGESKALIPGEDLSKLVDAQKEILTENVVKQECATKEPSSTPKTSDLTSLILEKMRNRNNLNVPKDNGVPLQAESKSWKVKKLPEGSSQPVGEDKWDQDTNLIRNRATKKRGNLASGGAMSNLVKTEEGENQDDFADLDLPQECNEAVPPKLSNNANSSPRPATDAFRNLTLNVKPKGDGLQGLNAKRKDNGFQGYQQKAKESTPVSFSFLKSLDATATTSGVVEDDSFFGSNAINSKDSLPNVRSTSQNLTPDFLKSFGAKNEPTHEARSSSYHEVKRISSHEAKSVSSHESKSASMERPVRAPSNANEVTSATTRTKYPGYTVCIRNLPSHGNLALVKEALSLHGEVISSFKKSNSDGTCNAFVEFKTAEAMDGALASRWVNFDSKAFSIVRADAPITTVVRLSRVSTETTDSQLFSICEKFGSLDNIRRRGNGVYDLFYRVNELSKMSTILDSLNEVTLNQSRLVALPAPLLHPAIRKEVLKGSEGQAWVASQLSQTLKRIECGLDTVSVCFEDLKTLTAMEEELTK